MHLYSVIRFGWSVVEDIGSVAAPLVVLPIRLVCSSRLVLPISSLLSTSDSMLHCVVALLPGFYRIMLRIHSSSIADILFGYRLFYRSETSTGVCYCLLFASCFACCLFPWLWFVSLYFFHHSNGSPTHSFAQMYVED